MGEHACSIQLTSRRVGWDRSHLGAVREEPSAFGHHASVIVAPSDFGSAAGGSGRRRRRRRGRTARQQVHRHCNIRTD